MNKEFESRVVQYFGDNSKKFLEKLNEPCTQGFFLNTNKANKEEILSLIDFEYSESNLTNLNYYHSCDNIGKTKLYELGLIYPQEIAASLSSTFVNPNNIKTVVDMCAAPGGKSINVLNKLDKDILMIANDFNHSRVNVLCQNLERLGLDNVIVTNKKCEALANQLEGYADLVILDAPCSGEGMIRKYPEILDEYSVNNINGLAKLQESLLEDAYRLLKGNGQLLYSTCTYAFEEDENQIINFLSKHGDMKLIEIGPKHSSKLNGTIKLSPLDNTEGQFICLMIKENNELKTNIKYLKHVKEKLVDDFIKENIDINDYYLYKHNNYYYLSLIPLLDLGNNVMRYGTYLGEIVNKRFEPAHSLYRSNSLRKYFKNKYDLNDDEYLKYISGNELNVNTQNGYYLITYKGYSLGFGKCSNNHMKNKYPKGLRRL